MPHGPTWILERSMKEVRKNASLKSYKVVSYQRTERKWNLEVQYREEEKT